jgi:plastocyanin
MRTVSRFGGAIVLGAVVLFAMHAGAAEAGGGGCHSNVITEGAGLSVELRGICFEPTVLNVQVGDRVTWTNRDAEPHTVTGAANVWGNYDAIQKDGSISFSFDEAGVYPYVCWLHPNMLGAVVVTEASAPIAVSDLVVPQAEPEPAAPEAVAVEAEGDDGVAAALAVGGVGLGLLAGFGSSAGWRRWRATRS